MVVGPHGKVGVGVSVVWKSDVFLGEDGLCFCVFFLEGWGGATTKKGDTLKKDVGGGCFSVFFC